jgi:3-isopropylmalate/(R)-2-methylmalate dehydratase small subunit
VTKTREMSTTGRAWVFPDPNIDTDAIMPAAAFKVKPEERVSMVFAASRPGWAAQVGAGDVLVGGRNFGTGASRPAPQLLRQLGISALVAVSINETFYRNCVNYAMPVMECERALDIVGEGEQVRVDVVNGLLTNVGTGAQASGPPMPDMLVEMIESGGLHARLVRQGYFNR